MATLDDIFSFLERTNGCLASELSADTDLWKEIGIEGDDFFELEEAFGREFAVDMSSYLWYFHHGEEPGNFGALFFRPPYARVERIPITPALLLKAANGKEWPVKYPPHEIPSHRYDITVNKVMLVGLFALVAVWGLYRALA